MSDKLSFLSSDIRHLSLRPRRDRGRALHDRPFVVRRVEHGEAILPVTLPGRAVTVLREQRRRNRYLVPGLAPPEFAPPGPAAPGAAGVGGVFASAPPGLAAPSLPGSGGEHGPMQNSTPSLLR